MKQKTRNYQLTFFTLLLSVFPIIVHNQVLSYAEKSEEIGYINRFLIDFLKNGELPITGFYIISGYLLFRKYDNRDYFNILKKKAMTLFLPYVLWNIVGMFYSFCVTHISFLKVYSSMEPFELTWKVLIKGIFLQEYNGPFWYIKYLIVFVILSPVFELILKKKSTRICFGIIILFYYIFWGQYAVVQNHGFASYYIGAVLGKIVPDFIEHKSSLKQNIAIKCAIFFGLETLHWHISNVFTGNISGMCCYLLNIVIVYVLWEIMGDLIKDRDVSIKNYSFAVYALHWYVLSVVQKIMPKIIPCNNWTVIVVFWIVTIITVVVVMGISKVWEKVLPRIYGIFMGGR